jgi:hypothetical protein
VSRKEGSSRSSIGAVVDWSTLQRRRAEEKIAEKRNEKEGVNSRS